MQTHIVFGIFLLFKIVSANGEVQAQSTFISRELLYSLFAICFGAILLFLFFEKRNNYHYTRAFRGVVGDFIYRLRSRRDSKRKELREIIETDQPFTPKFQGPQLQKAYIQAYPLGLPQSKEGINKQQQVLPQQIQSQNPQANFKDVFVKKQSKSKHKANKKSKSKLKNKLLEKNSDGQQEQRENNSIVDDQLAEQDQLSIEKAQSDENTG